MEKQLECVHGNLYLSILFFLIDHESIFKYYVYKIDLGLKTNKEFQTFSATTVKMNSYVVNLNKLLYNSCNGHEMVNKDARKTKV